jgi:hypothetical protein
VVLVVLALVEVDAALPEPEPQAAASRLTPASTRSTKNLVTLTLTADLLIATLLPSVNSGANIAGDPPPESCRGRLLRSVRCVG